MTLGQIAVPIAPSEAETLELRATTRIRYDAELFNALLHELMTEEIRVAGLDLSALSGEIPESLSTVVQTLNTREARP